MQRVPFRPLARGLFTAAAFAMLAALPFGGTAMEDWQLGAGPFVTGADVRAHNGLAQDAADMAELLAAEPPDFAAALEVYAFGRHFPWRDGTHSLGRFADDYNRAMPTVLPSAVEHFGGPTYQNRFLFSAIAGTRQFQGADAAVRAAAVEGGSLAVILNWCRFELAMAERKALAAEPNWSIKNGSPKNWNEIFAFYWGPEGRHSVFAAVAELPGGEALNETLLEVLTRGQESVLAESWPKGEAAAAADLLDQAGELLFSDALATAAEADEAALPAAVMHAGGLWLAAAESISGRDAEAAAAIDGALVPQPERAAVEEAANTLAALVQPTE